MFELFGFEPLETPIIELKETLFGKGGDETNRLIYAFSKGPDDIGLRFDHTVPLARVVAQHLGEITIPYRRYAIGPVFRADKPQKGRYRQFWQCDFDMVGTRSPVADAEVIALSYTTLTRLGFTDQFVTDVFDRRALNGMAQVIGALTKEQSFAVLRGWDKLAKVPREKIGAEVEVAGVDREVFNRYTDELLAIANSSVANDRVIDCLAELFPNNQLATEGFQGLREILRYLAAYGVPEKRVRINPTLARGLDYYTGPIFETVVEEAGVGSVTGGGRFDNLIEDLGGPSIPATGSSFGLERLVEVLRILNIAQPEKTPVQVFVASFDTRSTELVEHAVTIATELRHSGIRTELFMGEGTLGKQLQVADRRGAPYAVFAGPDEMAQKAVVIKNLRTELVNGDKVKMKTANQRLVPRRELAAELRRLIA